MALIDIAINEKGEHWDKRIKVCGITVYHRHDITKDTPHRHVGFEVYPTAITEVEDEDYWPEECKHR